MHTHTRRQETENRQLSRQYLSLLRLSSASLKSTASSAHHLSPAQRFSTAQHRGGEGESRARARGDHTCSFSILSLLFLGSSLPSDSLCAPLHTNAFHFILSLSFSPSPSLSLSLPSCDIHALQTLFFLGFLLSIAPLFLCSPCVCVCV